MASGVSDDDTEAGISLEVMAEGEEEEEDEEEGVKPRVIDKTRKNHWETMRAKRESANPQLGGVIQCPGALAIDTKWAVTSTPLAFARKVLGYACGIDFSDVHMDGGAGIGYDPRTASPDIQDK